MATITNTFFSGTLKAGVTTSANDTIPTGVSTLQITFSMLQTDADSTATDVKFQLFRNDTGNEEVGWEFVGGPNQGDNGTQTPNTIVLQTDIGSLQGVTVHAVITSATRMTNVTAQIVLS